MNIGKKIKELRRKNDLTQEKLAALLGISSQAVSKWECGVTWPDLSLLPALTRLFHVTADELLGLSEGERDERRAFFDAAMDRYQQDDMEIYTKHAQEAVHEFPGDMKYLAWYASCMQMKAVALLDDSKRIALEEQAVRLCDTVLENTSDMEIRCKALITAVFSLEDAGRLEEALKYAEQYPPTQGISREYLIGRTLRGRKRKEYDQKLLLKALENLLSAMIPSDPTDERIPVLCGAVEKIVQVCFPEGNYLYQYDYLFLAQYMLACHLAYQGGAAEDIVPVLCRARDYALSFDRYFLDRKGEYFYTSPLFSRVSIRAEDFCYFGDHLRLEILQDYLRSAVWFDKIRQEPAFQELMYSNAISPRTYP